ncbi:hypothetical protein EON81_03335 [bacterium]|nr:MAG: hypothetical protein EON81_03335 [bacterium]
MQNPNYVQYPRFQEKRVRFEALGESFNVFKRDAGLYIVATLPCLVVMILCSIAIFAAIFQAGGRTTLDGVILQYGISFVLCFVEYLTVALLIRIAVKRIDGLPAKPFEDLAKLPWGALIGATVLVGILVGFGSYMCLLPGFIAAGLFLLTYPLITEQRMGALGAMSSSFEAVKPSMWTAVGLYFVASLVMGLSAACCLVGLLVGLPVFAITIAIVYRDMFPANPQPGPLA